MLFNSYEFLFLFLPISFALFWAGHSLRWRLTFLTVASYVFYSWWQFADASNPLGEFIGSLRVWEHRGLHRFLHDWRFTLVMLGSSSVDYFAAKALAMMPARGTTEDAPSDEQPSAVLRYRHSPPDNTLARKALLALSLSVNLGLLAFFKYAGFFSFIAGSISKFAGGGPIPIIAVVLPVGISFYTFESMSYVIDVYRGVAKPARSYLDYACFISFFPHLVAGPIIRWSDILHQFRDTSWGRRGPNWEQVQTGLMLLTMGMAKKLLIADYLAGEINPLWNALGKGEHLGLSGSWAAVLGYTFRIYFDFSGYSDIAGGIGHLFAVRLPQNFDSPYKATDPSDFWRRWHITLSTFLRDYLYIPLGGNRGGLFKTIRNLVVTMLLGGLWHGAAWLFILWGAWHGFLLALWHLMQRFKLTVSNKTTLGHWANRQTTFLLVIIGWVLFRAADVKTRSYGLPSLVPAWHMLADMVGLHRMHIHRLGGSPLLWLLIAFSWAWCNLMPNSYQIAYSRRVRPIFGIVAGAVLAVCVIHFGVRIDFLYFRF